MAITKAQTKRGVQTNSLGPGAAGRGLATGSLRTNRDIAGDRLMGLAEEKGMNVDRLEPGGFANRDRIEQAARSAAQQEKRKRRAFNMAYRDAVRRGDRAGALNIILKAEETGTPFGGVRPAGDAEASVMQKQGEDFITAFQRQQKSGQGGGVQAAQGGLQTGGVETGRVGGRGPQPAGGSVDPGFYIGGRAGGRGPEPASLTNKYDNSPPAADPLRGGGGAVLPPNTSDEKSLSGSAYNKALDVDLFQDRGEAGRGLIGTILPTDVVTRELARRERLKSAEDEELEGLTNPRFEGGGEDEELQSLENIQSFDVATRELARRKRLAEDVATRELARRERLAEDADIRAGQVQKVSRYEPFTAEAMGAQQQGATGRGTSVQDQRRFFSNASRGLGRGIRNPEFSKIRQETQREMLRGRLNPRFAAQYLKDVADVFKDYESMRRSGLTDSVASPPSGEERARNPRALFDWVSSVKEQRLRLRRENAASQSKFDKLFSR